MPGVGGILIHPPARAPRPAAQRRPWGQLALLLCVGSIIPAYLLATWTPLYENDALWLTGHPLSPLVVPHYPPLYPLFTRAVNYVTMYAVYRHTGDFNPGLAFNLNDVGLYVIVVIQHALAVLALAVFALHAAGTLGRRLLAMLLLSANPVLFICCHNVMTEGLLCSLVVFLLVFALRVVRHPGAGSWRDHLGCAALLCLCIWTRHPAAVLAALVPGVSLALLALRRDRPATTKFAAALACSLLAVWASGEVTKRLCRRINHEEYEAIWGRAATYRVLAPHWAEMPPARRDDFIQRAQAHAPDPLVVRSIPEVVRDDNPWVGSWNIVRKTMIDAGVEAPTIAQVDRVLNGVCTACFATGDPELFRSARDDLAAYLWGRRTSEVIDLVLLYRTSWHHDRIKNNELLLKMCKHLSQFAPDGGAAELTDADYHRFDLWYVDHQCPGDGAAAPAGMMAPARVDRLAGAGALQAMAPLNNLEYLAGLLVLTAAALLLRLTDRTDALFALGCLVVALLYLVLMAAVTVYLARYALVATYLCHPVAALLAGTVGRRRGAAGVGAASPRGTPPLRAAA